MEQKKTLQIDSITYCQGVNPLLTKGTKLMKRKQKINQTHKNIFPKVGYMLIDVGAEWSVHRGFFVLFIIICLNISII